MDDECNAKIAVGAAAKILDKIDVLIGPGCSDGSNFIILFS